MANKQENGLANMTVASTGEKQEGKKKAHWPAVLNRMAGNTCSEEDHLADERGGGGMRCMDIPRGEFQAEGAAGRSLGRTCLCDNVRRPVCKEQKGQGQKRMNF